MIKKTIPIYQNEERLKNIVKPSVVSPHQFPAVAGYGWSGMMISGLVMFTASDGQHHGSEISSGHFLQ